MGRFDRLLERGVADGSVTSVARHHRKTEPNHDILRFTRPGYAVNLLRLNQSQQFVLIVAGGSGPPARDEGEAVDQYLAVVWALGAPIRRPHTGFDFDTLDDFVGALSLQPTSALDHLWPHSHRVRAVEIRAEGRRFMLVSFYDTDPAALEGVPFITSRYENVTVLEIDF